MNRHQVARGFLAGTVAGLAAVATMYLLAAVAGVRTLPALLSEPLLAVMPGPVFGFLIDRLQHLGKVLEEAGLAVAMVAGLTALGAAAAAVRGRRPGFRAPLAAAALAWLVVAAAALPLAGEGFFGLAAGLATPFCWGVVFAVYAFVLEMASGPAPAVDHGRRRVLGGASLGVAALSLGVIGFRLVPALLQAVARPAQAGGAIPPELTPASDFYVVSKNFDDPVVDARSWTLTVHGLVATPLKLSYSDLQALPATTLVATLECISNVVGGNQISTGRFTGARLAELVRTASPAAGARFVNFRAVDGYTESLPLEVVLGDLEILVVHQLDGAPLPPGHGFPARLLIPGRYGMKGPKWLTDIELAGAQAGGYWEGQGWDRNAVVKTMSRIDTPLDGGIVSGAITVGGVAFAGTRGISTVELSTDAGRTWAAASLRPPLSPLAWTVWTFEWTPPRGEHTLVVRAADGEGALQSASAADSFPSGASGYHRVRVSVTG